MSGRVKGIAKNLTASMAFHVVAVVQQLALTPIFLRSYGLAGLGQWLALSATVSYLGTLDFGIQTFVNQDLTVRYHLGDLKGFHIQQSTGLRLLLGIILVAALLATSVLAMPLEHWLRMDGTGAGARMSAQVVRGTVFLMALQILFNIVLGFLTGQFMVLGRAHLGGYCTNVKNLSLILSAIPFVLLKKSFFVVASAQLTAMCCCVLGTLFLLHRVGPDIFPTLRFWDGSAVPKILKPSGYFALIFASNFLVYQVPVIILTRGAGPEAVAIFSVTRTIFSMTRNVINAFTQSIGPEVTTLFARKDWPRLSKLYEFSERLVFSLIPVANIGTLFLCPFLLTIWLRKPQMFVLSVYLLSAGVSIAMAAKEHKFQFQFSTNTHRELARFMFATYLVLAASWFVLVPRFGVNGLLSAWLAVELVQVLYIMRLNIAFFGDEKAVDLQYPIKLTLLSGVFLVGTYYIMPWSIHLTLPLQVGLAVLIGTLLLALDVPLFGLPQVIRQAVEGVMRKRMAAREPAAVDATL